MLDWFAAGVASTKTAMDIAKSLATLHNEEAVRARVFDLTQSLMELQQQLMTAQMEQMDLVKKVEKLETDLSKAIARTNTEGRYQRHVFCTGSFAYKLKPEFEGNEVEHYLCSNCFEKNEFVTLQPSGGMGWKGLKCPRCERTLSSEHLPVQHTVPTRRR